MGTKISALPAAATLDGTELVPVVQAASNAKATTQQIRAFAQTTAVSTQLASYTPVLADANSYIRMNNAAPLNFTVPPNVLVPFPIGTILEGDQAGAGALTIVAGAGVTLLSRGADLTLFGQYSVFSMRKVATNTWVVTGDL
jgi:hypothetical protein